MNLRVALGLVAEDLVAVADRGGVEVRLAGLPLTLDGFDAQVWLDGGDDVLIAERQRTARAAITAGGGEIA